MEGGGTDGWLPLVYLFSILPLIHGILACDFIPGLFNFGVAATSSNPDPYRHARSSITVVAHKRPPKCQITAKSEHVVAARPLLIFLVCTFHYSIVSTVASSLTRRVTHGVVFYTQSFKPFIVAPFSLQNKLGTQTPDQIKQKQGQKKQELRTLAS